MCCAAAAAADSTEKITCRVFAMLELSPGECSPMHSRYRPSTNEGVQIDVSFYPALAESHIKEHSTRLDRKASFGPFPRFCMHSLED